MSTRIAQIKVYPDKGKLDANFERLLLALDSLSSLDPDVVITPEGFLDGYVSTEDSVTPLSIRQYAVEPQSSPYVDVLASWAGDNNAWLIFGCTRKTQRGAANTALIFDRAGNLHGLYDKTHLQSHDYKYQPGSSLPVFDSDFGPFGVLICADRRWPETVRTLALGGARIVLNPTYGMHDERNLHMMQTRSYESEIFIAFTHPGQALITGPRGEILCNEESDTVDVALTDVDLAVADRVRSRGNSHLSDRRADLYAP